MKEKKNSKKVFKSWKASVNLVTLKRWTRLVRDGIKISCLQGRAFELYDDKTRFIYHLSIQFKLDKQNKPTNLSIHGVQTNHRSQQKDKFKKHILLHAWSFSVQNKMRLIKLATNVHQKRVSILPIISPKSVNHQTNFTSHLIFLCVFMLFYFVQTFMHTASFSGVYILQI